MMMRFGILGCANIANKVVVGIKNCEKCECVAVGSRSKEKAEKFANKHGIENAFDAYDKVINCEEVDAVYIPLPTTFHKEWVRRAANAGKHILIEKPVAVNLIDLIDMIKICLENNVLLMDNVMFMHNKRIHAMTSLKRELFGKDNPVKHVESTFSFPGTEEFFNTNIRVSKDGDPLGSLGDLGWYCLRIILWAYEYELPKRVHAIGINNDVGIPIVCNAFFEYDDNVPVQDRRTAAMNVSFCRALDQRVCVLGRMKNKLEVDDFVLNDPSKTEIVVKHQEGTTDGVLKTSQVHSFDENCDCADIQAFCETKESSDEGAIKGSDKGAKNDSLLSQWNRLGFQSLNNYGKEYIETFPHHLQHANVFDHFADCCSNPEYLKFSREHMFSLPRRYLWFMMFTQLLTQATQKAMESGKSSNINFKTFMEMVDKVLFEDGTFKVEFD